jgi:DNA-directed RNA polymerase subunit RPC12/RpoP
VVVVDGVRCPYCGFEGELKLLKTRRYSWWNVYLYECSKCDGRFRWQVDPTGVKKRCMIRVGVRGRGRMREGARGR